MSPPKRPKIALNSMSSVEKANKIGISMQRLFVPSGMNKVSSILKYCETVTILKKTGHSLA